MRLRTYAAATAAAGLLAIATPVAGASADAVPAAPGTPAPAAPSFTFGPADGAPFGVEMAPIVVNGKVLYPGLHLEMPGIPLPPITVTVPPITNAGG